MSKGFMTSNKRLIHRPCPENLLSSLLLLRRLGLSMIHNPYCFREPCIWLNALISWSLRGPSKRISNNSLDFYPWDSFLKVNPNCNVFCNLINWEFLLSSSPGSFLLNSSSVSLLFPLTFCCNQQEETRPQLQLFAWKSLQLNSQAYHFNYRTQFS